MEDENKEKEFVCASCDSKATGEAGTCCGGERKEAPNQSVQGETCESCHQAKEADGSHTCA